MLFTSNNKIKHLTDKMSKIWMSRGDSRFHPTCRKLQTPFDILFVCGKVRDKAAVSNMPFIPDARGHMSACVQIHVHCYPEV